MITLEHEARISGNTKEDVIDKRRCYAAAKDVCANMGFAVLGGMAGAASAVGANYYYPKDIVNCVAFSVISLISAGVAIKGLYEIAKFGINFARGSRDNDPSFSNYLEEQYPHPNLLEPVFVDKKGRLKN